VTVRKVGIIFANNWVKVTKSSGYNSFAWALSREQSVIRGFQVSSDCIVRTGKGMGHGFNSTLSRPSTFSSSTPNAFP
jgi:hypothetical protein